MAKKSKKKSPEFLTDKELFERMDIEATIKARNQLVKENELIKEYEFLNNKTLSIEEYTMLKIKNDLYENFKDYEIKILKEIEEDSSKLASWVHTLVAVKQELKSAKLSGLQWSDTKNTLLGQVKILIVKLSNYKKVLEINKHNGSLHSDKEKLKLIEAHLSEIKERAFNNLEDYNKAVNTVYNYFTKSLTAKTPIFVRNRNKKRLAGALGEIWKKLKSKQFDYSFLLFVKNSFSNFSNEKVNKKNIKDSNLYKYLHTN